MKPVYCHRSLLSLWKCVWGQVVFSSTPTHTFAAMVTLLIFKFSTCQVLTQKEYRYKMHPSWGVHACECVWVFSSPVRFPVSHEIHYCSRVTQPYSVAVLRNFGPGLHLSLFLRCPPWHFSPPQEALLVSEATQTSFTSCTPAPELDDLRYWLAESFFSLTHIRLGTNIFLRLLGGGREHIGVTPNSFQIRASQANPTES